MEDFSVAFTLFGYSIKWYSLLILIAVVLGYLIINNEAKRFNIRNDFMFNILFWVIIFGIIGARLYYVLFNLDYYKDNISEIFKIWNGGLAIHGGIITGFIVMLFYSKKYKVSLLRLLDIFAPALLLAQAIGRWGNFFNKEAYGSVVSYQTLIDLKIIPSYIIDNMYINGTYHLPMFYFESLWCIVGFIIILFVRRIKYVKCGNITSFYLIWYGIGRLIVESFRTDSLMLGNIKIARLVSALFKVTGLIIIFIKSAKPKLDDLYNTNEEIDIKY